MPLTKLAKRLLVASVLLASLSSLAQAINLVNPLPEFSIRLTPKAQTLPSGSEIVVKVTLTNITHHAINVVIVPDAKMAWANYAIHVVRTDGGTVSETEYGKRAKPNRYLGSMIAMPVRPGETVEQQAILSTMFDMSAPGEYQATMDCPATTRGPSTTRGPANQITSAPAKITILP